ncbi:hypothetical protein BDR26DRAFT_853983, partial [Obelidium mucronatum]
KYRKELDNLVAENNRLKTEFAIKTGEVFNLRAAIAKAEADLRIANEAVSKQSLNAETEKEAIRRQFDTEIGRLRTELHFKNQELTDATQLVRNAAKAAALSATQHISAVSPPAKLVRKQDLSHQEIPVAVPPTRQKIQTSQQNYTPPISQRNDKFSTRNSVLLRLLQNFIPESQISSTRSIVTVNQPPDGYNTFLEFLRKQAAGGEPPLESLLPFFDSLITRCVNNISNNNGFAFYGVKLLKGIEILSTDSDSKKAMLSETNGFIFHDQTCALLKLFQQSKELEMGQKKYLEDMLVIMLTVMTTLAFDCNKGLLNRFNGILDPELIFQIYDVQTSPRVVKSCSNFLARTMLNQECFKTLFMTPPATIFGTICKYMYHSTVDDKPVAAIQPTARLLEVICFKDIGQLSRTKAFPQAVQRFLGATYHVADVFIDDKKGSLEGLQRLLRLTINLLSTMNPHSPETTIEYQFVAVLARTKHERALNHVSEDLLDFFI